jgi:hypothetical protein
MHRKVAAALVAALALAVAGCGGSEETLTRAQLVRRIETACREAQRAAQEEIRAARGSEDQQSFIAALLAGQKVQMDALDDVDATGAAKADFEAFKEGVQARVDAVERVSSADRADFQRAMSAAQPEAEAASRKVEAAARSLGVEGCQ